MPEKPVRLVIADDAAEVRLLLKMGITRDGRIKVVGEAVDGQTAVDVVDACSPDIVILDISMPIMDGLQAAEEIRKRSDGIGILMLSGFQASDMESKALAAGADLYVEKDGDLKKLAAKVIELAGRVRGGAGRAHPG